MINFLRSLWERISSIIFPDDYYAWQTLIYLGLFSFVMSWVARLAVGQGLTVNIIATCGWIFFALGIGWLLEDRQIRLFGISIAPWVIGAIVCIYFFGLVEWGTWAIALMSWPLVSVAIAAAPQFFTWELKPKVPEPTMRLQLILLLLVALLFSNWFQFYFRLQNWFEDYPSLLADTFDRSGFVLRLSDWSEEQARGIVLLTSAEMELEEALNNTPWPYVERWLLNLDDKVANIEGRTIDTLASPKEKPLWQLAARPRTLESGSYALDLMAVWSGPASTQNGYYLEKTCVISPRSPVAPANAAETVAEPVTPMAEVDCELATPRYPGRPDLSA